MSSSADALALVNAYHDARSKITGLQALLVAAEAVDPVVQTTVDNLNLQITAAQADHDDMTPH